MSDKCCDCWHVAHEGRLTINKKIKKYYVWIRNPTCECECHTPDTEVLPAIEVNIKNSDSLCTVKEKIKKSLWNEKNA